MFSDWILIGYAWVTTSIWQWLAVPWLIPAFKTKTATAGWAWGRLISWLTLSLIIWFGAHLGLPINSGVFIWLLILVAAFFSQKKWQLNKLEIVTWLKDRRQLIIWQEVLFLIGFFGLSFIRTFNPEILDLEKFMDAGLMIAYRKSPTLPLQDMWLAGKTFNYYTFGHFMGAFVSQFWSLDISLAYNLLLGLICGLVLMESFAIVVDLATGSANLLPTSKSESSAIGAGLIASLLVGIGGNGQALWYWLKNHSFKSYWYPDATRFIDRTIHEFPSYSFIVSDLHAHVWGIPIILLTLWIIWLWLREMMAINEKADWFSWIFDAAGKFSLGLGVLFGILIMTSTWDFAVYGLVIGLVSVGVLIYRIKDWKIILARLLVAAGMILITAILISSCWWLHFESISQGVKIAYEHSPLWQLAVLWLPHITLSAVGVFVAVLAWKKLLVEKNTSKLLKTSLITRQASLIWIVAISLAAWMLIIIPELIFVKDIYPNHPRANTMFKLTFQAFIMMGLVIGWLAGQLAQFKFQFKNSTNYFWLWFGRWLLAAFIIGVAVYPFFGYRDYYNGLKIRVGLDGTNWLKTQFPDDYAAINWLNNTVKGRPVIVEAVGESYTTFARVSTFTGLPTLLGWRVHEWLWRGGFDIPGKRTDEVKSIYEQPTSEATKTLLAQYLVKYIFIGTKEIEAYPNLDLVGLKTLGQVVFQSGATEIIEVYSIN